MKFDQLDVKILRSLQTDARTKFSDIAKLTDMSVDSIAKRYKRLQRNKIVKNTTLLLDPRKLENHIIVNFDIDVKPANIQNALNLLKEKEGILFATISLGDYNIFALAELNSVEHMNKLREDIKSLPMVRSVSTSIWVEQFLLCPQNFELEPVTVK
jgi:DNA-binding Lrp family transcriptional regulator